MLRKELNKWQYGIAAGKRPIGKAGLRPFVRIWFLKLLRLPSEGECLGKEHYKGFMLYWEWTLPEVFILRRTFRIFGRCVSIYYPIKIKTYER